MFCEDYAIKIPVGKRKIFLETKPCAPLQVSVTPTITGLGEALRNQIPVHGFVSWLCEWVYFKNSLQMKQIHDRLRYVVLRGTHVTI